MRAAPYLFVLGLAAACGGKSQQAGPSTSDGGESQGARADNGGTASLSGSSSGAGTATTGGATPQCAVTLRGPEHEQTIATTLEMAALAKPDTPVPLYISLVDVDAARDAPKAEKERLFDPYQAVIEQRLLERGATNLSRYWTSNAINATLEARFVSEVPCWPNVVSVEVDAPYWSIAEPPWGPDEAGSNECPLSAAGGCPEHCFELQALPYVGEAGSGCFIGPEVVAACSRAPFGFDDGEYLCRQQVSSGRQFLFRVEPPPEAPAFIGWDDCENPTLVVCVD